MKTLRRPLPSINHQAAQVVFHLRLMLLQVSERPVEPFFFSSEENEANGAPRPLARAHDGFRSSKRRGRSRTVVRRSFAQVPGIEVSANYKNFLRMFAPANLADHVGGLDGTIGKRVLHIEAHPRRHAAFEETLQLPLVFSRHGHYG